VLEGGRRRMTRVVGDIRQPRRMETCGAEEPYEGNLHVRFCGGSGRVIADPTRTADCLQPPLRCGFRQRLRPSVRPSGGQKSACLLLLGETNIQPTFRTEALSLVHFYR